MIKKTAAILALILVALTAHAAPAAPASSGPVVIKIGSIAPSRSPWDKALERVARDWERISNGTVQVRIYPGGIAGSEQDMIRKIRLGTLQGGVFSNMGLAKIDGSVTAITIPFLFHSREEFNVVFDRMKPSFEKMIEGKGFKVMLWTLAGWVNFFTKKEVIDPDDLKKLKIAVTADFPEIEQLWRKMGYEVVPGGLNDLMIQLQSGAVSAAYLPARLCRSIRARLLAGPRGRVGAVLRPRPPHAFAVPGPTRRRALIERQSLGGDPRRPAPAAHRRRSRRGQGTLRRNDGPRG